MKVSGQDASAYKAVLLDSLNDVPGQLISADTETGEVSTKDKTGETKNFTFGPHRIRLVRKSPYGR